MAIARVEPIESQWQAVTESGERRLFECYDGDPAYRRDRLKERRVGLDHKEGQPWPIGGSGRSEEPQHLGWAEVVGGGESLEEAVEGLVAGDAGPSR